MVRIELIAFPTIILLFLPHRILLAQKCQWLSLRTNLIPSILYHIYTCNHSQSNFLHNHRNIYRSFGRRPVKYLESKLQYLSLRLHILFQKDL